jgi:hypothetical protein
MAKRIYEIVRHEDIIDLVPQADTAYVLSDDFLKASEDASQIEDRIAKKYLALMDLNLEEAEETLVTLYPQEMYHLLVFLQRETLKLSQQ